MDTVFIEGLKDTILAIVITLVVASLPIYAIVRKYNHSKNTYCVTNEMIIEVKDKNIEESQVIVRVKPTIMYNYIPHYYVSDNEIKVEVSESVYDRLKIGDCIGVSRIETYQNDTDILESVSYEYVVK